MPIHQQRQDYYRDANQPHPRHPQKPMSPILYNEMPNSRSGLNYLLLTT